MGPRVTETQLSPSRCPSMVTPVCRQCTQQVTGVSAARKPRFPGESLLEGQPASLGDREHVQGLLGGEERGAGVEGTLPWLPSMTHHTRLIFRSHGSGQVTQIVGAGVPGRDMSRGLAQVACGPPASPGRHARSRPRVHAPTCSAVWQRRYRQRSLGEGGTPEILGPVYTIKSTESFQVPTRRPAG